MGCQLWESRENSNNINSLKKSAEKATDHVGHLKLRSSPVLVVDLITKTWCVYDSQFHSYTFLFNVWGGGKKSQSSHTVTTTTTL